MSNKCEIGSRVGAILAAGHGVVQLLGFGVYQGDEVPPDEGPASMTSLLNEAGYPNPKLGLDNGDTVWGCECWWSSEDDIKSRLAYWERHGWEVRVVSIEDARRRSEELSRGGLKGVMTHCPGCRKTHPTGTREVPCCNPLCGGNWGTGCYHCHHPSFAPPRDFPEQCLHEKGCELWRVPGTNYCGEHQGGIEALNRGDGCNRDWLAAFTALRDLEAARRQDEATLRNSLAIAQQLVRTERHLDALVVLYRAEDLEFEMTADCQVTGPVTDSLLRQLGLDDETAFEAWCTAQEPHEKDSAS